MARILVPIGGAYDGGEVTPAGERLDLEWDGAELGGLDSLAHFWAAVATVEAKDWIWGARFPLVRGGPAALALLHPDAAVRRQAVAAAEAAVREAGAAGARYIVFPFPAPGVAVPAAGGADAAAPIPLLPAEAWPDAGAVWAATREVVAALAEVQARTEVQVVLGAAGPHPAFYQGDLWDRLWEAYPDLTLAVDLAGLPALAASHGLAAADLARRLLPRCNHLYLAEARWPGGPFGVPAHPDRRAEEGWLGAAALAAEWAAGRRRARVVLAHSPAAAPAEREAAHAWARQHLGG